MDDKTVRWAIRVTHGDGSRNWLIDGGGSLRDACSQRAEWWQRWAAIRELEHMRAREPGTIYRLVRLTRKPRAEKCGYCRDVESRSVPLGALVNEVIKQRDAALAEVERLKGELALASWLKARIAECGAGTSR